MKLCLTLHREIKIKSRRCSNCCQVRDPGWPVAEVGVGVWVGIGVRVAVGVYDGVGVRVAHGRRDGGGR